MQRIQYFITALPFLLGGIFCIFYSKRLALALIKSTKVMNETFNIKKNFSKGEEFFIRICVVIFGVIIVLGGMKLIIAGLRV